MTRAQILAKRKESAKKNLSRAVKTEIRRSCAFTKPDECEAQLNVGMESMVAADMIQRYTLVKSESFFNDDNAFCLSYQQPEILGGDWVTFDFNLVLTNTTNT